SVVILLGGAGAAAAGIALTHAGTARQETAPRIHPTAVPVGRPQAVHRSGPLPGALLIADRGNNRIILVAPGRRVLWRFPTAADLAHGIHLRYNDDAFVAPGGQRIVANEEDAHTIVSIGIRTHGRIHLYGQPGVRGSAPGLLDTPDDAYPLPGRVV